MNTFRPEKELEFSDINPLFIERRFRKVNPGLIIRSFRLAQKYRSGKQTFMLNIYYVRGTSILSQLRKILDIVGCFIECHAGRYLQIEVMCTLQEVLLISEDTSVVWIDGEPFPVTESGNHEE